MDISFDQSNIDNYSSQELIYFFNKFWGGSKSSFAHEYDIHKGNFSKWVDGKNKKESYISCKAVKIFLVKYHTDVIMMANTEEIKPNYLIKKLRCNPPAVLEKIVTISNLGKLGTLVFVDVDNMIGDIARLSCYDNTTSHIILFISNKTISAHVHFELKKPHFSLVRARTTSKNAADTVLSVTASSLNLMLPKIINFVIISRDGFIGELKETMNLIVGDRNIQCGSPESFFKY